LGDLDLDLDLLLGRRERDPLLLLLPLLLSLLPLLLLSPLLFRSGLENSTITFDPSNSLPSISRTHSSASLGLENSTKANPYFKSVLTTFPYLEKESSMSRSLVRLLRRPT